MRSFFLFVTITALAGFITTLLGLFAFDWSITNTLPYAIVSFLILFQSYAGFFSKGKRFQQISSVLFTVQLTLSLLYFFDQIDFKNSWEWMLLLVLLGIQISIISVTQIETTLTMKHKLLLGIGSISGVSLLFTPIHPFFSTLFIIGLFCSSLLAVFIIASTKQTSH